MRLKTRIDLSYKDNHKLYHMLITKNTKYSTKLILLVFRHGIYTINNMVNDLINEIKEATK